MWWLTGAIVIVLLTFSPVIPLLILYWLGMADGLHEGNSAIAALPWALFFTLPAGIACLFFWAIRGIASLFGDIEHREN